MLIKILRKIVVVTTNVREISFGERNRDRIFHIIALELDGYLIWSNCMKIEMLINLADQEYNVFDSQYDTIILDDAKSWPIILQDTYCFDELDAK